MAQAGLKLAAGQLVKAPLRRIVTGDKDLLEHPGLNPPALTPRAACELLGLA
ncbi:MAG TPA: hypothetical protein VFF79_16255 [Conexibacter sp.]|jgi:hypothetical protein|nr:hypothetical protein [Conexibacter sp.]